MRVKKEEGLSRVFVILSMLRQCLNDRVNSEGVRERGGERVQEKRRERV